MDSFSFTDSRMTRGQSNEGVVRTVRIFLATALSISAVPKSLSTCTRSTRSSPRYSLTMN